MYIGYDEEQEALRQELRAYYDQLLTPEVQEGLADANGVGPAMRKVVTPDGRATAGSASAGPRSTAARAGRPDRAVHLLRRVDARRRPGADAHHQHRRPDDHALRHRRAEGASSCRRSSRARSTSASATPSPAPAPTSPRSRPGPCATATSTSSTARRSAPASPATPTTCWLAVRTNPDGHEAQGHLDVHRAHGHARHHGRAACTCWASTTSTRSSTTTCGCRPTNLVGGENNGWTLITNQLNHERVTLCSSGHARARRSTTSARWAAGDQAGRRPPRDRPGVGAAQPGPGPRRARVPAPHQLEGGVDAPPRASLDVGRRVDHQGVRHRVLPRGLPPADGDHRPASLPARAARPRRCCTAGSSASTAASSSSPSAAAPTRCSAT